jgi:membrane protein implicated in regulation of membrane protease activity
VNGAFGYDWGTLAFGSFAILCGLLVLLVPTRIEVRETPDWLRDARLRYGSGNVETPPAKPANRPERVSGAFMILFGVTQFIGHGSLSVAPGFLIVMGVILFVLCLLMLAVRIWRPSTDASWRDRSHRRKLERRIARGEDAYFEELRTLLAGDPPIRRRTRGWEFVHIILVGLFGAGLIAAGTVGGGR